MRGPKNRFLGFQATKEVLERLLKCPVTTHKQLWDPTLGPMEHHGSVKSELCEFHPFPAKFASHSCPKCCGTVLRGPQNWFTGVPARKKSAGRPSILSQDTTQSLWDPTVGSPGHPGSGEIQRKKIYHFPAKFTPSNARAGARLVGHIWWGTLRPRNPPAGKRTLGCLLQCPKTPQNQYGTPPWGPRGTLVLAKSKTS